MILMNIFGIPLNGIVVTVLLNLHRLGSTNALGIGMTTLGIAVMLMVVLANRQLDNNHNKNNT